jgi:hypothetical protein
MKKLYLILIIALFEISFAKANPVIIYPVLITEVYLDSNNRWTIELYINNTGYNNLDSFKLVTNSGEALFKQGIAVNYGDIILITEDSMQTPLSIDRYADNIILKGYGYGMWSYSGIPIQYGLSSNNLSYPQLGQSIEIYYYSMSTFYYVKSSTPSLGVFSNSAISGLGRISGHIYDKYNNLIEGDLVRIYIYPTQTSNSNYNILDTIDNNAYHHHTLLSRYYNVDIRQTSTAALLADTIILIEPDSETICDFHLNVSINNINENRLINNNFTLTNYPNPFIENTTIEIKTINNKTFSNAIIKIFNNAGEIMKIIPVDNYITKTNSYSISFSNKNQILEAGIYYYTLEVEGKKIASNKITIIR